ncbi:MAG TPA: hypothetical protein VIU63_00980 [Nitrospira sp.]
MVSCTPLTFLLTGFIWLVFSSLLGIAMLLGLVYGTPLPAWLRVVHVHGVLLGGLLQLIIGGLLAFMSPVSDHAGNVSRPLLFVTFNAATIGLLICMGFGLYQVAGVIGLVLTAAVASIAKPAWNHAQAHLAGHGIPTWVGGASIGALLAGLLIGAGVSFHLLPEYYAHMRLLHLHLIVLGFLAMTGTALTQYFLPIVLRRTIANLIVARITTGLLLIGFAALLGSFLSSSLRLELALGSLLVVGVCLYAANLLRTWLTAGSPGDASSDHLLIATVFFVFLMVAGVLMAANFLPDPPMFPMGSLHLIAYTHLAFLGFMVNIVLGALSYSLPVFLAESRVTNSSIRNAYRDQLVAVMNRWRTVQLIGVSLGTMGLAVIASLTWIVPLNSLSIRLSTWLTIGLLIAGLTVFSAKLAWITGLQPAERS